MVDQRLIESLERHEGFRDKAYQDSEGIWTIGYGTNLQVLKIDEQLARRLMLDSVEDAASAARRFPEYHRMDTDARRNVFIEMVYNMGPSRVARFQKMLLAIREKDFDRAATEMLDSKWARQVGVRATRLSELMRHGHYETNGS